MALEPVRLTVSDLDRSRVFYERVLGLRVTAVDGEVLGVGAPGERTLIELREDPAAPRLDQRRCGLFHFAILLPERRDLAAALMRIVASGWALSGASDHLVSEALYLDDPDGNGIEVYWDRPRAQWPHTPDGGLRMATLPLDLQALAGELRRSAPDGHAPPGTRIGHIHLQVADLQAAEPFYRELLGLDVTVRGYPGALFLSEGGYHHHVGLNTWHSLGADAAPVDGIGLRSFTMSLGSEPALASVLSRLEQAGLPLEPGPDGAAALVRDPSGIAVALSV